MKRLRSKLKNLAVMALALCLLCALSAGNAEQSFDADAFMTSINGTYGALFSVITQPEYDSVWLERCTEYAGEEDAQAAMDYLKAVCCGDVYGEEAVKAYGGALDDARFFCGFLGGAAQLTFDDGTISGVDADGSELFSHKYAYVGDSAEMGFHLYRTDDADAGAFTYFAMRDDTPGSTYHLEFRYGDDVEALDNYVEGKYAYWMAAGFSADYDDDLVYKVIDLFCEENLTAADDAQE